MSAEETTTRYFDWGGDACRLHCERYGKLSADMYVTGEGAVPIDATKLLYDSYEISEKRYKAMVTEMVTLRHTGKVSS